MRTTSYELDLGVLGAVTVEVDYHYAPGDPGRVYGCHPDMAYPPEPEELEVVAVELNGQALTGKVLDLFVDHLNSDPGFHEHVLAIYFYRDDEP